MAEAPVLSDDDLAYIRDFIGSTPDDDTVSDTWAEVGYDRDKATARILRRRFADMAAQPAQFAIPGEYSQNTTANLQALQKQVDIVEASGTEGGGEIVTVSELVRRRRR